MRYHVKIEFKSNVDRIFFASSKTELDEKINALKEKVEKQLGGYGVEFTQINEFPETGNFENLLALIRSGLHEEGISQYEYNILQVLYGFIFALYQKDDYRDKFINNLRETYSLMVVTLKEQNLTERQKFEQVEQILKDNTFA